MSLVKMTYPCKRRIDVRSMVQWLYKNRGRPDISDSRQWRETSNFVLNVVAKVVPCEGYATENGWLIDIFGASGETVSDYFTIINNIFSCRSTSDYASVLNCY